MEKSLKFRQSNGNNSSIIGDILMKLPLHHLTMVLYIQYKFDEILSIGYQVMAEDGKSDGWATPNLYPSAFGIIKATFPPSLLRIVQNTLPESVISSTVIAGD